MRCFKHCPYVVHFALGVAGVTSSTVFYAVSGAVSAVASGTAFNATSGVMTGAFMVLFSSKLSVCDRP